MNFKLLTDEYKINSGDVPETLYKFSINKGSDNVDAFLRFVPQYIKYYKDYEDLVSEKFDEKFIWNFYDFIEDNTVDVKQISEKKLLQGPSDRSDINTTVSSKKHDKEKTIFKGTFPFFIDISFKNVADTKENKFKSRITGPEKVFNILKEVRGAGIELDSRQPLDSNKKIFVNDITDKLELNINDLPSFITAINLNTLTNDQFNTFSSSKITYKELIGYKIEKYLSSGMNTPIQTFFIDAANESNIYDFVDTQIKTKTKYKYRFYTIYVIGGYKRGDSLEQTPEVIVPSIPSQTKKVEGTLDFSRYIGSPSNPLGWVIIQRTGDRGGSQPRGPSNVPGYAYLVEIIAYLMANTLESTIKIYSQYRSPDQRLEKIREIIVRPLPTQEREKEKIIEERQMIIEKISIEDASTIIDLYQQMSNDGILKIVTVGPARNSETNGPVTNDIKYSNAQPRLFIGEIFGGESGDIVVQDYPPLPPDIEIIPFKGISDKLRINLTSNVGLKQLPAVYFSEEDKNSKQQFLVKDNNNNNKIIHKSTYPFKSVEMYITDKLPKTYSDLGTPQIIDNKEMFSGVFKDIQIEENKKYYMLFRSINHHDLYSYPSELFEVRIVNDKGSIYPEIKALNISYKEDKIEYLDTLEESLLDTTKPFKRFLSISPALGHVTYNSNDVLNNANTLLTPAIWGEEFKIRITSKSTGKKIDLKVIFKKDVK